MLRQAWLTIRSRTIPRSVLHIIVRPLTLTIIAALLLGATTGEIFAHAGEGNRVVVGNTGGTLSSVIQLDNRLIVFGGGNARTDLADLFGRSTLPWRRHIDLLIVPGWDSQQALGAIGLLEHANVTQIIIVGQPSTETVWNVLLQSASSHAVPVTVTSGKNRIALGPDAEIQLFTSPTTATATSEYALMTLQYDQVQLAFLDASNAGLTALSASDADFSRTHLLVLTRPFYPQTISSVLEMQPPAEKAAEVGEVTATYSREVRAGQHVGVQFASDELRLSLESLQLVGAGSPTPAASK